MKIYLTNQNLKHHLNLLKTKKVMFFDKEKLKETISIQEINTTKKLNEIDLRFLFNYNIFPDNIMTYYTQWNDENRAIRIGDIIAQQVYIPPIKSVSQKIIFGVKINEIIDEIDKKGFSYETLEGHVEKGISTFTVEEQDHKIIFKIQTFSKPGNLLTSLLGPIISVPYQTYCTKKALKNVQNQIEIQ